MQNIDNLPQNIHAHDDTPVLRGVQAIAGFIGTHVTFTQLLLETEVLKGTKKEGDWIAKATALEGYRDAIRLDHRRQNAAVAFGPDGYPRSASFSS